MHLGSGLIAYIDPASGMILLQIVIAAIVGTGMFFRRALWRVVGIFYRKRDDKSPEEGAMEESAEE